MFKKYVEYFSKLWLSGDAWLRVSLLVRCQISCLIIYAK